MTTSVCLLIVIDLVPVSVVSVVYVVVTVVFLHTSATLDSVHVIIVPFFMHFIGSFMVVLTKPQHSSVLNVGSHLDGFLSKFL